MFHGKKIVVVMPAYNAAKTIEKTYREIPLVIISTEGSERDRAKGLGLGADAYLVKPFDPEALRQIARDLLASRRGQ